jgi:hypothetical protein
VALAGCTGSTDDDGVDGGDGGGGGNGGGQEKIDDFSHNYTIKEDSYKGFNFRVEQQGTIEWDAIVRSEYAVDIIVLTQDEMDAFNNQERFEYLSTASTLDTTGDEVSATIPEGEYALIVDNSEMAEAAPPTNFDDDLAEVEIEGALYAG